MRHMMKSSIWLAEVGGHRGMSMMVGVVQHKRAERVNGSKQKAQEDPEPSGHHRVTPCHCSSSLFVDIDRTKTSPEAMLLG